MGFPATTHRSGEPHRSLRPPSPPRDARRQRPTDGGTPAAPPTAQRRVAHRGRHPASSTLLARPDASHNSWEPAVTSVTSIDPPKSPSSGFGQQPPRGSGKHLHRMAISMLASWPRVGGTRLRCKSADRVRRPAARVVEGGERSGGLPERGVVAGGPPNAPPPLPRYALLLGRSVPGGPVRTAGKVAVHV